MINRKIKVAVIGLGMGRTHLSSYQNLPELFEVTAVCDFQTEQLRTCDVAWTTRIVQEVFVSDQVDLVDICAPPNTHLELIRLAIQAGKHVVCEEPLVGSLEEADEMESLLANAKSRLFPVFHNRFGDGLQKLRHLREKGFCSHALLTTIETHWRLDANYYKTRWSGKWATEMGGVCLTQAMRAHDILTYVLGPIRTVYSRLTTHANNIEGKDCAAITLEMCDGSLAVLSATLGAAVETSRIKFMFQDVTVESTGKHPYQPANGNWTFRGKTSESNTQVQAALREVEDGHKSFESQLSRIHATLCFNADPPVLLEDAGASLDLITAIQHCGETGAAVTLANSKSHAKYSNWVPTAGGFLRTVFKV